MNIEVLLARTNHCLSAPCLSACAAGGGVVLVYTPTRGHMAAAGCLRRAALHDDSAIASCAARACV
eukprot:CAMPEP_0114425824 /NCGR_PEP_ID=MMETSP0103-20121206/7447_1 /TAXON_ID=37642 ORGANISM="Paraphysomonas imperforata, Strain PA2" /NCGR_SAMPLE_ID=MMETSP0103 /ASSEMBLY_ACC=CAM_ASM_000201 /LENGTH=65 /DNA_ID=CAMNT_0001594697 /DNA_START=407 /DNA_END=604 /DNA_ORIENTATION=+